MPISTQTVSVSIVLGTRSTQAASFGTPAVFCNAPFVGGKLYEGSSEGLAAMVTDGFTLNDRGYLLAQTLISQEPHPAQFLVYNRAVNFTSVLDFTPLVTTIGTVYSFDLTYKNVKSTISHTVNVATVDAICDAIEILIDASAAGIAGASVAPDNAVATKLVFTGVTLGEPVLISNFNPALIKLLDTSTDAGIATDLAAANSAHSFYRFVIDSTSEAENNAARVWADANKNRFFAQSACTTNIADAAGTGVGQDFFAALSHRASVWHSNDMPGNAAAAIVGRQSALDPGTSGYHYKQLTGPAADSLTATHIANAKGKNVNLYALNNGTAHTWFGVAGSGRSLRVQDALDVLDARIGEAVLAVFLSNEYIPMSDSGFARQEAAVRGVLSGFQIQPGGVGFIEPGTITVTVPRASTLSAADKVAGLLNSIKFGCTIPNDMQKVVVQGNVSL